MKSIVFSFLLIIAAFTNGSLAGNPMDSFQKAAQQMISAGGSNPFMETMKQGMQMMESDDWQNQIMNMFQDMPAKAQEAFKGPIEQMQQQFQQMAEQGAPKEEFIQQMKSMMEMAKQQG